MHSTELVLTFAFLWVWNLALIFPYSTNVNQILGHVNNKTSPFSHLVLPEVVLLDEVPEDPARLQLVLVAVGVGAGNLAEVALALVALQGGQAGLLL